MKTIAIVFVLAGLVTAQAQDRQPFTDAHPQPTHKFFDRQNLALFALDGSLKATDAYLTHRNIAQYHRQGLPVVEVNPIARPFVPTTAGQIAFFSGSYAVAIGASYWLHKHNHHRLERAVSLFSISNSAVGIGICASRIGQ